MKYVRLYTGPDQLSHFEDVEVELDQAGSASQALSKPMETKAIQFRQNASAYQLDWHPAPRRQFVINLTGEVEITASDGEVRRFGPGTIMLAEDTTGKGHLSKAKSDEERLSLFVYLPEDPHP
jgi:hypothetical protein